MPQRWQSPYSAHSKRGTTCNGVFRPEKLSVGSDLGKETPGGEKGGSRHGNQSTGSDGNFPVARGQSRGCKEVGKPRGKVGAALGPTRPEETKVKIAQGQGGEATLTPSGPLSPDFTCDRASIPV